MKRPAWLRRLLSKVSTSTPANAPASERPMREFVYLDEVSLRSLLSSQTGEMTETTSEQSVDAQQGEIRSTTGVSAGAKIELASRYQTSNSSTLQTSRKATVQSWFRDLHNIPDLRLIEPQAEVEAALTVTDLIGTVNRSITIQSSELQRGRLVEFKVRLEADPVFRFTTLMTEFSGLADDHPLLFAANNGLTMLSQMEPVNRILQRLLAGLIPIRATAVDYVAATIGGTDYVVHRDAVDGLDLETRPLEVVGVTEHLAYWKDIRRVLFSRAEFTMLCRIARDGLQPTWTPVKLAELFLPFAPDLIDQINFHSRSSLEMQPGTNVNVNELLMNRALAEYRDAFLATNAKVLDDGQSSRLEELITQLQERVTSAWGQRSAFILLHDTLCAMTGVEPNAPSDLELRERVRMSSGLPLFPSLTQGTAFVSDPQAVPKAQEQTSLLDAEVVAIYW